MKVLYPYLIDSESAISKVYRNIGTRIDHECHAFVKDESSNFEGIMTKTIPDHNVTKFFKYAGEYFNKYDVIHTGPTSIHAPVSIIAKVTTNASTISTVHNAESFKRDLISKSSRSVQVMYSDQVTAVSPFVREFIKEEYNQEAEVIGNGVDFDFYRPDQAQTEPNRLLFVGRLVDRKNPELVVELARSMPSFNFNIRGGGKLTEKISNMGSSISNLTMLPRLTEEELAEEYAKAEAVLCPFQREGFGLVALEAMASGTPVIALDDGNLSYMVGNNAGLLCDNLSVKNWSSKIRKLKDRDLEPRSVIKPYSWSGIAEEYASLYESIA